MNRVKIKFMVALMLVVGVRVLFAADATSTPAPTIVPSILPVMRGQAESEAIEGVARLVGSDVNMTVVMTKPGEDKGPELCRNDVMKRVAKISGMTVRVLGTWKENAKAKTRCFEINDFTVLKMSSSEREPVVGRLVAHDDGTYTIEGEAGKKQSISGLPPGLRKMAGKKVIVDMKPMSTADGKSSAMKVVSYAEYP